MQRPTPYPRGRSIRYGAALAAVCASLLAGCTSPREWIRNGFKVGPAYCRPEAPVADDWIDANDQRLRSESDDHAAWWTVFDDPVLDRLIAEAYSQNLPLRVAGFRILEARALRAIAAGNVLPQQQQAFADYSHNVNSLRSFGFALPTRQFSLWDGGFNLAWELDFWGRFRRAVESADADLDASIENYDDVLVTLLADVATTYVEIRTLQRRLELAKANIELQRRSFELADTRFTKGAANEVDMQQAKSNLAQTEALVPQLEVALRQSQNQLCVLLGFPPEDLNARLGTAAIPTAPAEVAVGVPGELLRRRPDVRRAERQVAAQSARIGIAESEFYPHIAVTGVIGVEANQFQDLFKSGASFGSVGPSLRWNVLNYGRILNNVRAEDARFQQAAIAYQQTVLAANAEAENAIVAFLRSQQRRDALLRSAEAARRSNELVSSLYNVGDAGLDRVFVIQSFLVQQQDAAAESQGEVAKNLISIYRALGGGWQIRLGTGAVGVVRLPGVEPAPDAQRGTGEAMPEATPAPMPQPMPTPHAAPEPK
ncbi:MAG: transporter [Planctomycetota bacterium]|nr:MAG: transporter [Planctomycetota bacterium]